MLLITGCSTEKIADKSHVEEIEEVSDEKVEEEQSEEIGMRKERIETEAELLEEEDMDQGAESPLRFMP